ncbi:hypothetical protein JCM6882_002164 [Rhodosporidiobolus microsporus]
MPFGSPLVPSPTLGKASASPSSAADSPSTSPSFANKASSTTGSIASAGAGETVGLGVSGAGDLGVQEEDAAAGKVEVTSPLELTQFVDNLLNDLESRFDSLSQDVLSRLSSLSTRVDSLETSLSDLMSGTAGGPLPSISSAGEGTVAGASATAAGSP